jgi:hypothetical protein
MRARASGCAPARPARARSRPLRRKVNWTAGSIAARQLLTERIEVTRRAELPAECLANPVPQWMELDCKRRASLIEQRHRDILTLLRSERKRVRGNPEFAHCEA